MYPGKSISASGMGRAKAGVGRGRIMWAAGLAALAVAVFASRAGADPLWVYTWTDLGGGLYGFQFTIDCNDGLLEPVWCEMTYTGGLQNTKAFGAIDVDYEPVADTYDPLDPNYHKVLDSWINEEFSHAIQGQAGGTPTDNYFYIDSGTEAGVYYEVVDHAYIVATGAVFYSGRIGRHGVWYPISGWPFPPYLDADADGPYQIRPGEQITLDGSGSCGDQPIDSWLWDLDDDGDFDDASGEQVAVSYDYLVNGLGLGLGEHTIWLHIGTEWGEDWDTASLEIIPEPATLGLLAAGAWLVLRRRRQA